MVGKLVESTWGRKETTETQSESNFTRKKRSLRENGKEGTEKLSYGNAQETDHSGLPPFSFFIAILTQSSTQIRSNVRVCLPKIPTVLT